MRNLIAYFIIPLLTLLLPGNSDWMKTNFSVIGSQFPNQCYLILWGIFTGLYFYTIIGKIHLFAYKQLSHQTYLDYKTHETNPAWFQAPRILSKLSAILLLISVFIPYLPETIPFLSALHVLFALSASVGLFLCLSIISYQLAKHIPLYRYYLAVLAIVPPVCLILFFTAGNIISSSMEIFFTIFCSIYSIQLYHSLE